ncbi:MAG: AIPR family protein [Gallionellaceae bacterium]
MKYEILISILDRLCSEATSKHSSRYRPNELETEKINNARSRAFIHLYLKVMFGILDFEEREKHITDNSYDGGIDGYFIDEETKIIYLIQSKFRMSAKNFEGKEIALEEILTMDVNRILEGELSDENGNTYNGKIKQLQREISQIPDIARYSYRIVLLANLENVSATKLKQLTGGYAVEVFNFEKSYEKLVFPIISGTYFTASDINIPIDLSNKNAGSKISYTVKTKISDCEITVLFAPTIEIAKIMSKYKNTILKYNPRSYLEFSGKSVNDAIRSTILQTDTNEFALFNNGITLISDETYINEKIGQKNKAQLRIKNPQIINGGQTSYTLSRIYEEHKDNNPDSLFAEKEVLLKIITLIDNNSHENKLQLIDEISNATNKQTPVINADRFANEVIHQEIQKKVFDKFGLLYERKRGEFSDGLKSGYIDEEIIIERNLFLRLFFSSNGMVNKGIQKKLFQKNELSGLNLNEDIAFDKFYLGLHVFNQLSKLSVGPKWKKSPLPANINVALYAKVYIYNRLFFSDGLLIDSKVIDRNIEQMETIWQKFLQGIRVERRIKTFKIDSRTGVKTEVLVKEKNYINSPEFGRDISEFFEQNKSSIITEQTMSAS